MNISFGTLALTRTLIFSLVAFALIAYPRRSTADVTPHAQGPTRFQLLQFGWMESGLRQDDALETNLCDSRMTVHLTYS
jgi:hypothetical protein